MGIGAILVATLIYFAGNQRRKAENKQNAQGGLRNNKEELLYELRANLKIAKNCKENPWTEFSLKKQADLLKLKNSFTQEIFKKIERVYSELQNANHNIRQVRKGCWSEELFNKCFLNFIPKLTEIMEEINKNP